MEMMYASEEVPERTAVDIRPAPALLTRQTFIYVQAKRETFFKPVKRILQRTFGHEHTLSLNRRRRI